MPADKTLGRLATKAASVLSGKLNPQYVPYIDVGDHVIVINAEKVRLTGLKAAEQALSPLYRFPRRVARGVVSRAS
jgi:large subunit ribosomal protein L13